MKPQYINRNYDLSSPLGYHCCDNYIKINALIYRITSTHFIILFNGFPLMNVYTNAKSITNKNVKKCWFHLHLTLNYTRKTSKTFKTNYICD